VDSDSIIGLTTIVLLFGGGTLFLLSISPIGKAFAARIQAKRGAAGEADEQTAEEVKELRREVEELRHFGEQMNELGERVDFLERLVAKQREAERLPPAR
jgi:chromosome condensin MukBEF ATPase and DNA-binding subunit MukB